MISLIPIKTLNHMKKGKSKIKQCKLDLDNTFIRRELASVQHQLYSTIDEKDKCISVLLSRVKQLKDHVNATIYDRYFPSNNSEQTKSSDRFSSNHHSVHNCCHDVSRCPGTRALCECQNKSHQSCQQEGSSQLMTLISSLKESIDLLKSVINSLLSTKVCTNTCQANGSASSRSAAVQTVSTSVDIPPNLDNQMDNATNVDNPFDEITSLDESYASVESDMSSMGSLN